ncbi:MAG: hypothetical protein PHP65_01105 [Bacilli bacterium]|nr:hypothetical protein [Bacilli bacterium]
MRKRLEWKEIGSLLKKNTIPISIVVVVILLIPISTIELFTVNVSANQIRSFVPIVVGSLSSIFAIVFAIYILAFTLFEKNFSKLAYKKFINNPIMLKYVQFVVMTIFVFILLNSLLVEEVTDYVLNLMVFGIALYIIALIYIYPLMKSLVETSKSDVHIENLIKDVNISSVRNFLNARSSDEIKGNPIFEITGLTNVLINNNERILLVDIINSLEKKVTESITKNDEQITRDYLKGILSIYKSFINSGIKNNVYSISEFILDSYFTLKKYAAKNKKSHFIFMEFDRLIEDTVMKFIKLDNNEFVESYLHSIFSFIEYNIEHYLPNESELWTFNFKKGSTIDKKYDNSLSFQWDLIANECNFSVQRIVDLSSETDNYPILNSVGYQYVSFISYTINSKLLGDMQKRRLLLHYNYYLKKLIEKVINLHRAEVSLYFMSPFIYDEILEFNEDLFMNYYNSYEDVVILLFKTNQMSVFRLNDFGTMARGLPKYSNQYNVVPIVLKRIMMLLQKVGKKYIDELSFEKILVYKEIHKQSGSIIKFAESSGCKDDIIVELKEIHSKLEDPKDLDKLLDDIEVLYESRLSDL